MGKFRPIQVSGGNLQPPSYIRNKKCVINVKTENDDCFKYRYLINIYIYIYIYKYIPSLVQSRV